MKMSTSELLELYSYLRPCGAKLVGVMTVVSMSASGYKTVAWSRDKEGTYRYLVMKGN